MSQANRPVKRQIQTSSNKSKHQTSTHNQQSSSHNNSNQSVDIVNDIIKKINNLNHELKNYPIRELVEDAKKLGPYLKRQKLETNQVRKFLDAVNQIKSQLIQDKKEIQKLQQIQDKAERQKEKVQNSLQDLNKINEKIKQIQLEADKEKEKLIFSKIETEVVLLKPKLAYAAARQKAAKPLNDVMSVAIDAVESKEDFERLVQLIESIIAYHKAEGGK